MNKDYQTTVRSDDTETDLPTLAKFSIDEGTAREIVRLAAAVVDEGLYAGEKFDYRTAWITLDEESDSITDTATDADTLKVSATEFWFSAYLKFSNTEILTERQPISELMDHFGISAEPYVSVGSELARLEAEKQKLVAQLDAALQFVEQAAQLSIWSYDKDDGSAYAECEEPSEGFEDSHWCLMGLIEQARNLRVVKA